MVKEVSRTTIADDFYPEIHSADVLHKNIKEVLSTLRKTLEKSYGPLGGTTIIHSNGNTPVITKDGLTILKSIRFDSKIKFDIYRLICTISSNLVNKVGDGSTSSVLAATYLYKTLKEAREEFRTTKDFERSLKLTQDLIEAGIETFLTRKLTDIKDREKRIELLTQIAGISNNNDFHIGKEIANIMVDLHPDSLVKVELHPNDNTSPITYRYHNGFHFDKFRLAHPLYFNSSTTDKVELNKGAFVAMTYNLMEVHYNKLISYVTNKLSVNVPIVLIADTIQSEVKAQILKDSLQAITAGRVPMIYLVETGSLSNEGLLNTFSDLEVFVEADGASVNNLADPDIADVTDPIIGFADKVTFFKNNVIVFESGSGAKTVSEKYSNRVEELRKNLEELSIHQRVQRGNIRNRLNRLEGYNATILVGGRTEEEKTSLQFLVEDSVLACKSVIRKGFTLGGNYSVPYSLFIISLLLRDNGFEFSTEYPERFENFLNILERAKEDPKVSILVEKLLKDYSTFVNNKTVVDYNELEVQISNLDNIIELDYPILNLATGEKEYFTVSDKEKKIYATSVLSPVATDIEIMKATFSIVSLLVSSNQYIQ